MASTPEAKVKNKIKDILKRHNCYYAMPIGSGYGNAGVPDFLVCVGGFFLAIEAKAGTNQPTALQKKNLDRVREAGGAAMVVNEANLNDLDQLIYELLNS